MADDEIGGSGRHPLADRDRMERVWWVMHAQVQKLFFPHRPVDPEKEWVIPGGASLEDIVQEALSQLAARNPAEVESYEALGADIAKKKAVDALRRARLNEFNFSSLDAEPLDDGETPLRDRLADPAGVDPADEAEILDEERRIWSLAETLLDERERRIFYEVHYLGASRVQVGRGLDRPITGARVGQLYGEILVRLYRAMTGNTRRGSDGKEDGSR